MHGTHAHYESHPEHVGNLAPRFSCVLSVEFGYSSHFGWAEKTLVPEFLKSSVVEHFNEAIAAACPGPGKRPASPSLNHASLQASALTQAFGPLEAISDARGPGLFVCRGRPALWKMIPSIPYHYRSTCELFRKILPVLDSIFDMKILGAGMLSADTRLGKVNSSLCRRQWPSITQVLRY
ncbi:hypothetical protein K491DRAFT_73717 [Lophiostoma macrostomum CBS 122681]|uniref:Uncharacterized protein n=1 Tax=Lophiostoma macrostomum CBS 122681 TaxID=1314788 RepID=A0A6A6SY82_9PLEO|nr:hypothetical protein K491DRAFT_73717 [Lophiostoma macrostomum CBS 122681]